MSTYRYTDWGTASWDTASSSTTYNVRIPIYLWKPRNYLIIAPEHWSIEDCEAFAKLVNVETKTTSFTVTMIIEGDVIITDPNVETRTMKDFVPLLKYQAWARDREKIAAFFKEHPLRKE